jgi:hypothetical protein
VDAGATVTLPTDDELSKLDTLIEIEVPLPTSCKVLVYPSTQFPGERVIKVMVEASDVETGKPGGFDVTWTVKHLNRREIADAVIDMIKHEVEEQLALDPHGLQK